MSVRERVRKQVREQLRRSAERMGFEHEQMADEALEWLRENEKILAWWPADDHEDHVDKIDRHIMLLGGEEKLLQIKSSRSGMEHAKADHPEIPVIIVTGEYNTEELAYRILGVLQKKIVVT